MPTEITQENVERLFMLLLFANMCLYLEAGAIPAMLLQISDAFDMTAGHQGLLGGIPYLSIGFGSPIAGYLMRNYNTKYVLSRAIGINSAFTLIWALTPVGQWYSLPMFISARFVMGLMQCIVCVFMPLWTNEFAPPSQRTKWMGALQASVPFGVMSGYIIAAIMIGPSSGYDECFSILCWRLPLMVEWIILVPFSIAIHFVPSSHLIIPNKGTKIYDIQQQQQDQSGYSQRRHSIAGPPTASCYGSMGRTATPSHSTDSYSILVPTILRQGESVHELEQYVCPLSPIRRADEPSTADCIDDGGGLSPQRQIKQDVSVEHPTRVERDSLLDRNNHTDSDPGMEHIKRKGWHAAQRRSMCASLYTAMSAREALMKSPSDGEILTIPGIGYQSEENMLPHFHCHDRGDRTFDIDAEALSPVPRLDNLRGVMAGQFVASCANECLTSVPDGQVNIPSRTRIVPPPGSDSAVSPANTADKAGRAIQYESLSKMQREYFAMLSPGVSNHHRMWPESTDKFYGENDRLLKSRSAEISRHRSSELFRDSRFDDMLYESPQVATKPQGTWSRVTQREFDTESESDAFAELFFSPEHCKSHVSSEHTPWDWDRFCFTSRSSSLRTVSALLKISVYRNLLMALAALYFVVTGVQFWGTSYMLVALSAPRALVNTMFVFCAGTGPTMGVFCGGWVVDYMGGYVGSSQRVVVLKMCVVMGALGCCFASIAILVSSFYPFIICLWLVLFCGASLLPACSGILVSVVPRQYRPVSSSLSIMTFNLFGYSLSQFFSGYLMEAIDLYFPACDFICSRKVGFRLVLLWSFWSLFFISYALWSAIEHDRTVRLKWGKKRAMRIINSSLLVDRVR